MCVLLRGMGQGVCILEGAKGKVHVWEGMRCGCGCGGDEVCVCVCMCLGRGEVYVHTYLYSRYIALCV